MSQVNEKLLPQNVEAELGVLGSILIDPACLASVFGLLRPEDFYRAAHRDIYQAIVDLWRMRTPADLITLTDALERANKLEDVGGASFVSSLSNQVPTSANVEYYAEIVARTALARRVIHAAGQIAGSAYHEPESETLAVTAQRMLSEALARHATRESIPFDEAVDLFLDEQISAMEQGVVAGVQYEFPALDKALMGMKPGELVYLCGRPGSGKSAFAVTIAERVADTLALRGDNGGEVGTVEYITLEMRAQQVIGRILAAHADVDTRVIRSNFLRPDGTIDADAWTKIRQAAHDLKTWRKKYLRIQPHPMTVSQVRLHLERAVTQDGCRLAVLDYIGLVRPDTEGRESRKQPNEYQRITDFSRDLKQLALELNIPLLVLVQMNRQSEYRVNPRPTLSDLRDSGGLEQDADFIFGLHRAAAKMPRMADADARFREFAELLVLKAREGVPNVTLPLRYEGPYTRFDSWPADWPYRDYLNYKPSDEPEGASGNGGEE